MKKTIIILFFAIIFVQNMFAWGGAFRDVTKQPSATPTFYLGDVATFAWARSSSVPLVKIGVGILASPPAAYTNLTWNTPTGYIYPSYFGEMSNYTVTSVGTGYYSIWLGYGAAVGTNGSFFNGKNTTMTYGDNNNSSGTSTVPWNSTYCYGTFTVSAINDPTVTTPFTTTSSSVSLAWSKNTQSHNVMIVRKLSSATWTEPTQGTAYAIGASIGSGTVIYNSDGTSYSNTGLLSSTAYDYKFYSVNNSYYSSGVVASTKTSTAATDYFRSKTTGNWNSTDTWESSSNNTNWVQSTLVPSSSPTTVTILDGHIVSIDENVTVNSLIPNSGSSLTINAGKQLTVNSTLSNSGTLNLLSDVLGTATILTPSSLSGNGGIYNVNQHLTYRTWYMSSPVTSATNLGMNRIKYYNESTGAWSDAVTTMNEKIGYLVVPDNNDTNIQFSGNLNSGDKSITLTRSEANTLKPGFNLIGNPYPSYLDWVKVCNYSTDGGVTKPNQVAMPTTTMWYRTKVALNTIPVTYEYQFWTVNGIGEASPATASQYIPPMQAFWVRANTSNTPFILNNDMRMHAPTSNYLLKAPAIENEKNQRLRLQVSNGIKTDETLIYFNTNAADGFDVYDSPKMNNEDTSSPEIYSKVDNEQFVINGMSSIPLGKEIRLGVVGENATPLCIKANEISNISPDIRIILKDNIMNIETDLTDGITTYVFYPNAETSLNRFNIIFRSSTVIDGLDNYKDSKKISYSTENHQIRLMSNGEINESSFVSVYNSIGEQLVQVKLVNKNTLIDKSFLPGVYLLKINNVVHKVIVK